MMVMLRSINSSSIIYHPFQYTGNQHLVLHAALDNEPNCSAVNHIHIVQDLNPEP